MPTSKKRRKIKQGEMENNEHVAMVSNRFKEVKAKTAGQQAFIDTVNSNTITFCNGAAGSGKTHISVGLAVESLRKGRIKKIVISRPLVQNDEDAGTLPGDISAKLQPFLMPIYDEFKCFISESELQGWLTNGLVEICPLGFMRGRTFNNAFIILDEAQNATTSQLKMFLTRVGRESIIVVNGDTNQSDLPYWKAGGLDFYIEILQGISGIGISQLAACDIVRNPLIAKILERIDEYDRNKAASQ